MDTQTKKGKKICIMHFGLTAHGKLFWPENTHTK